MKSFSSILAAFFNVASVRGVFYLNLHFSLFFLVPSTSKPENLIQSVKMVHKFSIFPLDIGVMEGHVESNEEILSP
jgi:hypothetical protein